MHLRDRTGARRSDAHPQQSELVFACGENTHSVGVGRPAALQARAARKHARRGVSSAASLLSRSYLPRPSHVPGPSSPPADVKLALFWYAPRLGRARTPGVPITHRGAARPPEQAAPATMCTARTGQALTCPPAPALSPRALGLQTRCERAGRFFAAAPGRARSRRFARARAYAPGAGQRRSGQRDVEPFKF